MPKYRIIHVPGGACCWQLQQRVALFFWKNVCGQVASATTAAHEILRRNGEWDDAQKAHFDKMKRRALDAGA